MAYSLPIPAVLILSLSVSVTAVVASGSICKYEDAPSISVSAALPDSAFTASSSSDSMHGPNRARLHTTGNYRNRVGGWCSASKHTGEWIQVRLKDISRIHKVQTQGRHDWNQWVTKYKVSISIDCKSFSDYKENGKVKVFRGNNDRHSVITHSLEYQPTALCLRIVVLGYHAYTCMRFGIMWSKGCLDGYCPWQNSCYKLIKENFSWLDAVGYCKLEGGKLVTIETRAENTWLKQYLLTHDSLYAIFKDKSCQTPTLAHIRGSSLEQCRYICKAMPKCTGFVRSVASGDCWMKSCSKANLIKSQNKNTHLMPSRAGNIWMNVNRISAHNKWVTAPGTPAKFYNWAYQQPDGLYVENCGAMSPLHDYRWTSKPCATPLYSVCEI